MKYSEDAFSIELNDSSLLFSGKMEKSNYIEVENFLMDVDKEISASEITLDIRELKFLNSSGIRMLATFFMKSPKTFKVVINPSITWQKVGIVPLTRIRGNNEIQIVQ